MSEVIACVQTDRKMGGECNVNRRSVGMWYHLKEMRPYENYKICSKAFKLLFCLCTGVWVPVTTAWPFLRLRTEERPATWRVVANILNKQWRTADKVWSSSMENGLCDYSQTIRPCDYSQTIRICDYSQTIRICDYSQTIRLCDYSQTIRLCDYSQTIRLCDYSQTIQLCDYSQTISQSLNYINIKINFQEVESGRGGCMDWICLRIGTGGGRFWGRWWTFGLHKMWGISWLG